MSSESHSQPKYKENNKKMFGIFYFSILMSIGISLSIFGTATNGYSSNLMATRIYFTCMYLSASLVLIILWLYLFVNRNKTYESENKNKQLNFSRRGEKVNIYLRLGVAMFGLSTLLYSFGAVYIHYLDSDSPTSSVVHGISLILFVALQTIFILYYHRLIMLIHKNLTKIVLLHLTVTDMLIWANSSIGKVSSEFETSVPCNQSKNKALCMICTYLLPTVSEYAIITTAVIYEIYLRIGKFTLIELEQKNDNKGKFAQCTKTIPGLIIGILIVCSCLFSSVSSIVLHTLHIGDEWIYYYHSSLMIFLNIVGIVVLILGFLKIRTLKFSVAFTSNSLDRNILFISFIISINFSLLVLINCGNYLIQKENSNFMFNLNLRISSVIFEILQSILQTYIIIDWFQRCSYNNEQEHLEPGRNYVAILLGINLGMWFLWTMQIKNGDIIYFKSNDQYVFQSSDPSFSDIFTLFLQMTLPFGMLYRFHSSACLSEIFLKVYHTESERFVHHLKLGKLQNEFKEMTPFPLQNTCNNLENEYLNNFGYESDENLGSSICIHHKRSISLDLTRKLKRKYKKPTLPKRDTYKNIVEAHYKFNSQQILHKMHKRNIKEKILPYRFYSNESLSTLPKMNKIYRKTSF